MITPRYVIAFSGHRQLPQPEAVRLALRETFIRLQQQASEHGGALDLYCSAAYGADLIALDCARELGITIHLLLPLPEEEFAKDFAGHQVEWRIAHDSPVIRKVHPGVNFPMSQIESGLPLHPNLRPQELKMTPE